MKHPQINISYLIYYTTGQIQIKMDIIHRKKSNHLLRYYSICSLKTEKGTRNRSSKKKKKTAQRNSKYQDKFDHGFKKLVNIMPAWGEYFTCLLMWPSNPVSFLFFRKEKLFPLSSFLVRKIGFYTTFYDILTLAT